MENNFAQEKILYYPTIEFLDETWVKSALLFWDKIYRIVPQGYVPKDSEEIYIATQEGLIENVHLSEQDLKRTANEFLEFCDLQRPLPSGFSSEQYEIRLHSDKIDERLKPFFSQFSKAIDKEGFYTIPENIANGYMFFLSDAVSKRRNIPKLTDNPDMFAAMTYFDVEGEIDEWFTDADATESYSNLIIENLIPMDIRSWSIHELIKFNNSLSEYKKEFRKCVSEFNDKLSKIEDKSFALEEIRKFKHDLTAVNASKIEVMKTYFSEFKSSLLYIGLPVCVTSLIGSVYQSKEDLYSVMMGISKGILLGSVASLGNAGKEVRKRWSSSRSNYYLELKKHLLSTENATIQIANINRRLDEFIND